jgi:hypothetical protein
MKINLSKVLDIALDLAGLVVMLMLAGKVFEELDQSKTDRDLIMEAHKAGSANAARIQRIEVELGIVTPFEPVAIHEDERATEPQDTKPKRPRAATGKTKLAAVPEPPQEAAGE